MRRVRTWAILGLFLPLMTVAHAGDMAANFTLRDIDGANVTLSELKGNVVLISFWATWCGPCKEEMPHLQKLYTKWKDKGFVVLSISTDDARSASKVKPYIRKNGYTFPVLLDKSSTVVSTYNPGKTLPFTVILDRDLSYAKIHAGYTPGDEEELAKVVDTLMEKALMEKAVETEK